MRGLLRIVALAGVLMGAIATAGAARTPSVMPPASARLEVWGQRYLKAWHRRHPSQATLDGVHDFDAHLPSYSRESLEAERRELDRFGTELEAITASDLPRAAQLNLRLAQDNVAWRRLELHEWRPWETNPMRYADDISNGLLWLALYPTDSAARRLQFIVARETEISRLLAEARQNLQDPPVVFLEVAREAFVGLQALVAEDLPKAFKGVGSPQLRRAFRASSAEATVALAAFIAWLDHDLRPRAKGGFALGAERLAKLLRHKEGITASLDELEAMGQKELAAKEARFRDLARVLDARLSAREVWEAQRTGHPSAERLLAVAREQVATLERFVRDQRLVTIPPHQPLVVRPTPAVLPGSFASQYMVGPFEVKALPGRYFITLPDPSWDAGRREDHLGEFSVLPLWSTSAHEGFPGHYLQGIYLRQIRSCFRISELFASDCLVEGWAHYCEQLMVEQGFLAADQRFELGQVRESLLRATRFLVALRLHAGRMTLEEATRFFMDHVFMAEGPALVEAQRGTYEPTYLSYTYGKLELLRLREDFRQKEGRGFSLARFHERVLKEGQVPMWLLRAALLEEQP